MPNNNARNMRKNPTDAERKLWSRIRKKQLYNFRFRRQRPIGPYIADFYCVETKLVVELDGSQHYEEENIAYDKARTKWLNNEGISVIRFDNLEIFENMDGVLDTICFHLLQK